MPFRNLGIRRNASSPLLSHSSSCKDGTVLPPTTDALILLSGTQHAFSFIAYPPDVWQPVGTSPPITALPIHVPQNRLPPPPPRFVMPSPSAGDADLPISVIPHDLLPLPPTPRRRRRAWYHTRHPRTCFAHSSSSQCLDPHAYGSWCALRYGRSGDVAKHILAPSSGRASSATASARSWYGEARVRMPTTTTTRTSDGRRRRQAEAARRACARGQGKGGGLARGPETPGLELVGC